MSSGPLLVMVQPDYWPYLYSAANLAGKPVDDYVTSELGGVPARVYVVGRFRDTDGKKVHRPGHVPTEQSSGERPGW